MDFLIHEVSHAALRKTDVQIYDLLAAQQKKGTVTGLPDLPTNNNGKPIENKSTTSKALNDFFKNNCGGS